jgi:hypothetical protein
MRKLILAAIFVAGILLLLPVGGNGHAHAANVNFNVTVNSGSANPGTGNFQPTGSLNVNSGDNVTITFSVPSPDPYCCGIRVKSNGTEFDTGTIAKGSNKVVNFTAGSSFGFAATWPNGGPVKATGSVNVTTPTPTPPAVPTGLAANAISPSQIELSWNAASGATQYKVFRDNVQITTTGMLTYSDSGLSPATNYTYKLKATNGTMDSGFSSSASAMTQAPLPTFTPTPTPSNTPTPTPTSSVTQAPGQTATPTVTPTNSPTVTLTGTVTITPTVSGSPAPTPTAVFTDPKYDYVEVNGIVYPFDKIPQLHAGDKLDLYGRTVAFATITITVHSDPNTYTTVADSGGYWNQNIDLNDLLGDHTITEAVAPPSGLGVMLNKAISFKVASGAIPADANSTSSTKTGVIGALVPFGGIIAVIGALMAMVSLFLILGRSKKH